MNLEQQVCSLDLAKRLKELGVKQESLFWWSKRQNELPSEHVGWKLSEYPIGPAYGEDVSAFTVAELGTLLGKATREDFLETYLDVMALLHKQIDTSQMAHNLMTQPDIAAKMLIYLIENKLITA